MRPFLRLLIAALTLSAATGTLVALEVPPKPAAWVTDSAEIIDSAKEEALNRKLESFKQSGGGEILVFTFPSLEGEEVVDYTNRVADKWKIKGDRAAILFVFVRDRKTWIQVGYGLEGVITDSKASSIYRNVLVPNFRQGDYAGGIDKAVDQLIALASGRNVEIAPPPQSAAAPKADFAFRDLVVLLIIIFVFLIVLGPMFRRSGCGGCGGCWPLFLPFGGGGGGTTFGGGGDSGGGGFSVGGSWGGGGGSSFGGGGAGGSW